MKKLIKITIIGGYGGNNFGDDAQLFNNIRLLKENGYNDITVMSPKKYIKNLCDVKVIDSFWDLFPSNKKKDISYLLNIAFRLYKSVLNKDYYHPLIKHLSETDILFVSGCGMINTRHMQGLLVILIPILLAQEMGKRVILSGQGITPCDNHFLTPLITVALNRCEKIVLRDFALGAGLLRNINVMPSKIVIGCDDAFTTPPKQGSLPDIPQNVVAINISHYITDNFKVVLQRFCKQIKKEGYVPILNYFQTDMNEEQIAKDISQNEIPIYKINHPEEGAYFYEKVVASIGMRYHSFIFSIAGLSPVINIYANEYQRLKIEAIQKQYNFPYCMLDIKNADFDTLYKQFNLALKEQPEKLNRIHKIWSDLSNLGVKLLMEKKNDK